MRSVSLNSYISTSVPHPQVFLLRSQLSLRGSLLGEGRNFNFCSPPPAGGGVRGGGPFRFAKTSVCIFILALLGAFSNAHAQQIHGRLLDRQTKEAIAGATISFSHEGDSIRHKQITNVRGEFLLNSETECLVQIHALGYRDTTLTMKPSTAFQMVYLDASMKEQEQVVVTALRHGSTEQEVPVSTVVTRGAEIESHNPLGLDNALRYVPGVTVAEDQLSIRGSSGYSRSVGARVLLMLDGTPFLSADNGDMKFDAIPLLAVDRVEVVKGAGSALYGSSALGGVINVITREPSVTQRSIINIYSGFYDEPKYPEWQIPSISRRFYSIEGGTTGVVNNLGYLISGDYKRDEGYRLGDDTYRWNGFAKLTLPIDGANKISLSGLAANENHGGWLYWQSLANPLMPYDSLSAVNGRIHSFKSDVIGNWQSFLSEKTTLDVKINNFYTNFSTDPSFPGDTAGPHSNANNLNGDASITWIIDPQMVITAGGTAGWQTVTSDLFQDHHGILGGAFAQAEIKPWDALSVIPGIRWDDIKYDNASAEGQFSPKLGLSYVLSDAIALRASYGSGFRVPSISERYIESTIDGFQVRQNLSLEPEKSQSYEVGGTWNWQWLSVDAAGFYSLYHNLIEPSLISDPSGIYIQFRNLTQALIAGHEEGVTIRPFGDALELRGDYTYIYPENTETHQILEFRPRHVLLLSASGTFMHITAGADFRYISHYETMDSLLSTQIPDGGARVDAHVLDAQVGYDLNSTGLPLELTFQVKNLFNYYYVEIPGNLAPLRNYSLRLQADF
jgi:outer membrane receptor for ferrienterochelin and colicins